MPRTLSPRRCLAAACLMAAVAAAAAAASDKAQARRSFERAQDRFLAGDFQEALKQANASIANDSDQTLAYALRARIWQALDSPADSRKDAERVIKRTGSPALRLGDDELIASGSALLLGGMTEAALQRFDTALQLDPKSPEGLAGRARVWRARGLPEKAFEDLSTALTRSPRTPLYLYSRAGALYELGHHDQALADLTAALRINRTFYPAYAMVGTVLASKGDLPRAVAAYSKAIEVNPEYAYAFVGRAAVRFAQKVDEAGFQDLDEAARVAADDYAPYFNRAEAHWRRNEKDAALADFRKSLTASNLDGDAALRVGDRLVQVGLWNEAVPAYSRALELASAEQQALPAAALTALIRRARAFEMLKQPKRALDDLTEAVTRAPASGPAWAARGTLRLRLGQEEQALADLNQAVRADPKNAEARTARGSFYARTGKPKLALEDFNAAVLAEPKYAEAYNNRGALYANSFDDNEKALKDILKAVELKPQDPGYRFNLAMIRLKDRQYLASVEAFNQSLQLQGPPARVMTHRADAWSQLGDQATALEDIQVAIEKDPKYAPAYDVLGQIRMRSQDYEQAVREFNQALDIDPAYAGALVHRGEAHGALGAIKRANKDFKHAVELDPRSKEAHTGLCQARRLLRDTPAALSECSRAIELNQFYAPAFLQRGLAYLQARQPDRAIEDIDTAAQLGLVRAEGVLAQALAHASNRQYKQAHRYFETAAQINPAAHSPEVPFGIGRPDADEFFNAMTDVETAEQRKQANEPYAFVVRGDALRNAEHYDKAVVEYTKAMEIDGTLAAAYLGRGQCLLAQEALDSAQQDFLKAAELDPESAEPHVRLALALTLKKSYKSALAEAAKAVQLDANNAEAYLRAGNARYFLKEYGPAIQNYQLAVQKDPRNPAAHNGLGLGYFAAKRYPEALESFSRAISLDPTSDRYHRNRASTFVNMARFADAAADFRSASLLNTDPQQADEYKRLIEQAESHASPVPSRASAKS